MHVHKTLFKKSAFCKHLCTKQMSNNRCSIQQKYPFIGELRQENISVMAITINNAILNTVYNHKYIYICGKFICFIIPNLDRF